MSWQNFLELVESRAAEEAVNSFCDQFDRFEEAWEGLKWLLARNPDVGLHRVVDGDTYRLYVARGDAMAGTPEIWVLFEATAEQVIIHRVIAIAPETEH